MSIISHLMDCTVDTGDKSSRDNSCYMKSIAAIPLGDIAHVRRNNNEWQTMDDLHPLIVRKPPSHLRAVVFFYRADSSADASDCISRIDSSNETAIKKKSTFTSSKKSDRRGLLPKWCESFYFYMFYTWPCSKFNFISRSASLEEKRCCIGANREHSRMPSSTKTSKNRKHNQEWQKIRKRNWKENNKHATKSYAHQIKYKYVCVCAVIQIQRHPSPPSTIHILIHFILYSIAWIYEKTHTLTQSHMYVHYEWKKKQNENSAAFVLVFLFQRKLGTVINENIYNSDNGIIKDKLRTFFFGDFFFSTMKNKRFRTN